MADHTLIHIHSPFGTKGQQRPLHFLMRAYTVAPLAFTASLLLPYHALAVNGLQVPSIGAIQAGTAGAGVAGAHDSTWMILNPASISSLPQRFDYSAEIAKPNASTDIHGPAGLPNAVGTQDSSIYQVVPAISYVQPLAVGALGIGLFGSSGVATDYDQAITTPGQAGGFDKKISYKLVQNVLSYAYPVSDSFSLGVGLHLNYARFRSDMINSATLTETQGANKWDSAWGGGVQLGATQVIDQLKLGASYSFQQKMHRFDRYADVLRYSLNVPASAQVGASYHFSPDLEWVVDYKWIEWAGVKAFGNRAVDGGLGWKNQSIIMTGGTYTINDHWKMRAGFSYGNSPINEEAVFANAHIPVVSTTHATLGTSYALSPTTSINLAYIHAFKNSIADSGNGDTFSQLGRGTKSSLSVDSIVVGSSIKF